MLDALIYFPVGEKTINTDHDKIFLLFLKKIFFNQSRNSEYEWNVKQMYTACFEYLV